MCGRPVLCTQCGGPEDYMTSETGLLIPTDDEDALAAGLAQMLATYSTYDSERISAYARSLFSAEVVTGRIREVYEEALAGSSAQARGV